MGTEILSNSAVKQSIAADTSTALDNKDIQKGWFDFMAHLPFPDVYDGWDTPMQHRYELGRRCASIYVGLGMPREVLRNIGSYLELIWSSKSLVTSFTINCGIESRF